MIGKGSEAEWALSPSFTEYSFSVLNDIEMPVSEFISYLDTVGLIIQKKRRLIEFKHIVLTPLPHCINSKQGTNKNNYFLMSITFLFF